MEWESRQKDFEEFELAAETIIRNITSPEDLAFKETISEFLESMQDRYVQKNVKQTARQNFHHKIQ